MWRTIRGNHVYIKDGQILAGAGVGKTGKPVKMTKKELAAHFAELQKTEKKGAGKGGAKPKSTKRKPSDKEKPTEGKQVSKQPASSKPKRTKNEAGSHAKPPVRNTDKQGSAGVVKGKVAKPAEKKPKVKDVRTEGQKSNTLAYDVGEEVWGSRKDLATARTLLNEKLERGESVRSTLASLEKVDAGAAKRFCTKEFILQKFDWEAEQKRGTDLPIAMIKKLIYDRITPKPEKDDPEVRRQYAHAIEELHRILTPIKTMDELKATVYNLRDRMRLELPSDRATQERYLAYAQKKYDDPSESDLTERSYTTDEKGKLVVVQNKITVAQFRKKQQKRIDEIKEKIKQWEKNSKNPYHVLGGKLVSFFTDADSANKTINTVRRKNAKWEDYLEPQEKAPKPKRNRKAEWERKVDDPWFRQGGRKGKVQKPEDAIKQFGLRGVQFGHWVDDSSGKFHLLKAGEALQDLADTLGIKDTEVSLNGRLALAFGARGTGGKSAAVAHYEPDLRVINLTKEGGAGSLAHEWGHALDDILGDHSEIPLYASEAPEQVKNPQVRQAYSELMNAIYNGDGTYQGTEKIPNKQKRFSRYYPRRRDAVKEYGLTPEVVSSFADRINSSYDSEKARLEEMMNVSYYRSSAEKKLKTLETRRKRELNELYQELMYHHYRHTGEQVEHLEVPTKGSEYLNRMKELDGMRSKPYFSTGREMFARVFESWTEHQLNSKKAKNYYLVAGTSENAVKGGAPFPKGTERKLIFDKMSKLMKAIVETGEIKKALEFDLQKSVDIGAVHEHMLNQSFPKTVPEQWVQAYRDELREEPDLEEAYQAMIDKFHLDSGEELDFRNVVKKAGLEVPDEWVNKAIIPDPTGTSPYPEDGTVMYRGIGQREMDFINEKGYIQTKGKGNDDDKERETCFSNTFRQAEGYARSNYDLYGESQAYVLVLPRAPWVEEDEHGELVSKKPVPAFPMVVIPVDRELQKSWNEADHPRDEKGRFTDKGTAIPLDKRVQGDALLDAQDLIEEVKANGGDVDEYGYITLYHRTTKEAADNIKHTGKMKAAEDGLFFSTSRSGDNSSSYGSEVLTFKIPAEKLLLDDVFGNEAHVRIPLKSKHVVTDVSEYLQRSTKAKSSASDEVKGYNAKLTQLAKRFGSAEEFAQHVNRPGFGGKGINEIFAMIDENSHNHLDAGAIKATLKEGGDYYYLTHVDPNVLYIQDEDHLKGIHETPFNQENAKPIVVGNNNFIVDGRHRTVNAKQSNVAEMLAYVPAEAYWNLHVKGNPFMKGIFANAFAELLPKYDYDTEMTKSVVLQKAVKKDLPEGGVWRTVRGHKVYIKDGKVLAGGTPEIKASIEKKNPTKPTKAKAEPKAKAKAEPKAKAKAEPKAKAKAEPKAKAKAEPKAKAKAEPKAKAKAEPKAKAKAEPKAKAKAKKTTDPLTDIAQRSADVESFYLDANADPKLRDELKERMKKYEGSLMDKLEKLYKDLSGGNKAEEYAPSSSVKMGDFEAGKPKFAPSEVTVSLRKDGRKTLASAPVGSAIVIHPNLLDVDEEAKKYVIAHEAGHLISNAYPALEKHILENPEGALGSLNQKKGKFEGVGGTITPEESWADAVAYYFTDGDWLKSNHPKAYVMVRTVLKKIPEARSIVQSAMDVMEATEDKTTKQKEPWQTEFNKTSGVSIEDHKASVIGALQSGKAVPKGVIDSYPEIASIAKEYDFFKQYPTHDEQAKASKDLHAKIQHNGKTMAKKDWVQQMAKEGAQLTRNGVRYALEREVVNHRGNKDRVRTNISKYEATYFRHITKRKGE